MKSNTKLFTLIVGAFLLHATTATPLHAGPADNAGASASDSATDTRYGPFNLFDRRSGYGQDRFPEPFLVDDSDLEQGEARLDWLHTSLNNAHTDLLTAEVEKGFGLVTVELEVPFERDRNSDGTTDKGFNNVNVGARAPFYQYVSANGFLDTTFGVGLEAGIPTNSPLSKNAELVPKIFNDLRLGDHFTIQSVAGYSTLYGSGDNGGLETFEYGFVFGYTIQHKELPIPKVQQLIPVFELSGATELNKNNPDHNRLIGDIAIRVNTDAIGPIQPHVGFGFVFPMNQGARDDMHWGLITSLVFEY